VSDSFQVFGISPIVAVADVRSAVDFYVKHLGFEELFVAEDGSYGVAGLQNQSVHFVPAADAESLAALPNTAPSAFASSIWTTYGSRSI
jgi:catechol 2,3-dioxygenase-like lactoylglutathione lyase family enzyme